MKFKQKTFTCSEDLKISFDMNAAGSHRIRVHDAKTSKLRATGPLSAYGHPSIIKYNGRVFIAFSAFYESHVPFIEKPMELVSCTVDTEEAMKKNEGQPLKNQYEKACLTRIFAECSEVPFNDLKHFIFEQGFQNSDLTLGQLFLNHEAKALKDLKSQKPKTKKRKKRQGVIGRDGAHYPNSSSIDAHERWERWAEEERNLNFRLKEAGKLNFRIKKDRDIYDDFIFSFLKKWKDWESSDIIRKVCGGSAEQARSSLNRLIESGNVEYKGRGAALKYKASTKRAPFKQEECEIVIEDLSKDKSFTTMMTGCGEVSSHLPIIDSSND